MAMISSTTAGTADRYANEKERDLKTSYIFQLKWDKLLQRVWRGKPPT